MTSLRRRKEVVLKIVKRSLNPSHVKDSDLVLVDVEHDLYTPPAAAWVRASPQFVILARGF
ncbi:hypothetical protein BDZ89DRAFT_148815 [Hymenopellis radicata]|nr:hypothetical protein BDZ89DRAFT_148815 [Hymenopellis radicata]